MSTIGKDPCGLRACGAWACGECQLAAAGGCREEHWLQQERLVSIGRLASEVAHDFNNLLTAILGFAHLALAELEDEGHPAASDLREVVTAGESAASLASQLLSYARPAQQPPAPVDIRDVCQDSARMLRRVIGNGIELLVLPSALPLKVLIERHRLEQVIVNLVMNARDAMAGRGKITLACDSIVHTLGGSAPARRYIRLRVIDTGPGIPSKVLPHIFEPFFTTKASQGGTGLGLASCYQIVSEAGGEIAVSSSSAVGTEFTVLLPPATRRAEASDDLTGPAG